MRVVVVNPTYNQAENIERLVREVQAVAQASHLDIHQLIVADNSPDHTGKVVQELQAEYPKLHLITGPRQGLGAAIVRGFDYAIRATDTDVLVQMDADFSHDPRDMPRLLDEITAGEDVVIGSRYVPAGSIPAGWAFFAGSIPQEPAYLPGTSPGSPWYETSRPDIERFESREWPGK